MLIQLKIIQGYADSFVSKGPAHEKFLFFLFSFFFLFLVHAYQGQKKNPFQTTRTNSGSNSKEKKNTDLLVATSQRKPHPELPMQLVVRWIEMQRAHSNRFFLNEPA